VVGTGGDVTPLSATRALVTGGTSGIGRACVERLASDGASVVFTGRSPERGASVSRDTGATFLQADARDPDAVVASVEQVVEELGGLDVLVNNAGILFQGGIEATPPHAWRELIDVNLTAAFLYSRSCFGPMRDGGGGAMIHIVSDTGIRGIPSIAAYSVTKAGMRMLSDMLALEGAPVGIRSNAVCPGDVLPGVQATPVGFEHHAEDASIWTLPPCGRFAEGRDVASLVAYLSADEARHISGATIRIDGAGGAGLVPPAPDGDGS
jgi:NAD(P)-dependent dehydrogenase (short-subunit alcohol dehydrogenase family)